MSQAERRVQIAKWHHRRGMRMVQCSRHVESCGHSKAFLEAAAYYFGLRDQWMDMARAGAGKFKVYVWEIISGWQVVGIATGVDELDAGGRYEEAQINRDMPIPDYMVKKVRRHRGLAYVVGERL